MISTVLLLVDPDEERGVILRFARGLSALGVERIIAGHSIEVSGLEGPVIAVKMDAMRERIGAAVAPIREAGLDVEVRVGTGDPERELVHMALETRVDAVVAGTHGKSVADRLIVGSVSEKIAAHAGMPVMMVHFDLLHEEDDPADVARAFGTRLVVPTDFSESAERALDLVADMPAASLGEVRVLTVKTAEQGTEELDASVERLRERGIDAVGVTRAGSPGDEILAEAQEWGATGIMVGTRGRTAFGEALLGSVSMTLVRAAACPVVIVP